MLLDKTVITNIIRNSKDKEQMLDIIRRLPDMSDLNYTDIEMSYDLTLRGSQITNYQCPATVFVDKDGVLCISAYDGKLCCGVTLTIDRPCFIKHIKDLCSYALKIRQIEDTTSKQEEKDIVDIRESKVIELLDACIGQRFERKDMIPIHQGVLDFYSSRGKVKKLTGLQTTRFNAIISTLGYIQKSSYLDSVTGKRVYYIEKINE